MHRMTHACILRYPELTIRWTDRGNYWYRIGIAKALRMAMRM